MKIAVFNNLPEHEKVLMVWVLGVCLAERPHPDGKQKVLLFQIEGFYIEMDFNPTKNKMCNIKTFFSIEDLNPYLDSIDITGLLK